jgi:peptide/nickel transport system substrate-binding protein
MKKSALLLICVAVIFVFTPAMAAPKGKLTIAFDTDTPTMDPHAHAERAGVIVNWHFYDSLLLRQDDMTIVPGLAKSYKLLDNTTLQLDLRDGVTFHNGEPFNAECVKFSFDRVLDPKNKSPQISNVNWVESVEIVDEFTVKLHFKEPYPLWREKLQNFAMVPPKFIQEKGLQYFAEHAVGTGPYRFVKWTRGSELRMTANEAYYRGAPDIEDVVIKVIPDPSTQVAALLAGSVDYLRYVSPEEIPMLKARKDITVATVPILRFGWICLADALVPGSPMSDKRVRQALNYAVNLPEIMENIVGGLATRCVVFNPMQFGHDGTVEPYPYDPAKAKALLKEAGYGDGFSMTIHYTTANAIKVDEVLQAIQAQLGEVGVNVKLQKWSAVGYMQLVVTGKVHPAYYLNWGSYGVFDGDAILYPFFRSGQTYGNFWNNPELDKLLDQQRTEMDSKKRKEIMGKCQHIVREEAPWIFMYAFKMVKAMNARIDYQPRSDEIFYAYDASLKE